MPVLFKTDLSYEISRYFMERIRSLALRAVLYFDDKHRKKRAQGL